MNTFKMSFAFATPYAPSAGTGRRHQIPNHGGRRAGAALIGAYGLSLLTPFVGDIDDLQLYYRPLFDEVERSPRCCGAGKPRVRVDRRFGSCVRIERSGVAAYNIQIRYSGVPHWGRGRKEFYHRRAIDRSRSKWSDQPNRS